VRRERRVFGPILAAAVAALAVAWFLGRRAQESKPEWIAETRQAYARLWEDLQRRAGAAAAALGGPADTPAARLAAFSRLATIETGEGKGRQALLLLDPDGVPVAWAGEGLLHELPQELPRSGLHYRASFSAVTLLAIHPLGPTRRPWRVVAGVSFATDTLPFDGGAPVRWTVVDDPVQAVGGADVVTLRGAPALAIQRSAASLKPSGGRASRTAWAVIGLAAGLAIAAAGARSRSDGLGRLPPELKGAGAVLLLLAAGWGLQQLWGPLDLAGGIIASAGAFALRLGFTGAAFGLFCLFRRRGGRPAPRIPLAWIAVVLLLGGAALCDQPWLAVPLLCAGGAAITVYADERRLRDAVQDRGCPILMGEV